MLGVFDGNSNPTCCQYTTKVAVRKDCNVAIERTDLLKPANKKKLTGILTNHVVAKELMAADVAKLKEMQSVEGGALMIDVKDGKVMVNKAHVITTDIKCTNGVSHIIDAVMLPKE